MATPSPKETIGTLVKDEIDAGCGRMDMTRGELAERVGMHRVSLYNLLKKPGQISLQSLDRIMEVLEVPADRQGFLVYKWCEDRAASNHFAELLMPVLDELCAEHGITTEDVGARILRTFERLRAEG